MKCSGLKRLSLSVLLALGVSPAFADDANNEEITVKYGGVLTLNGFYGNDGNSMGSADLWQPIWQEWNKIAFIDIRGIKGENQIWEGNLGGGYRWLSPESEYLYGVYGFYDSRNSVLGNSFQQGTIGGEFKGEHWSFTGNYYIPFGTTKYYETSLNEAKLASVPREGYQNLLISNGYEQSLTGFDLEAGYDIPYAQGLRLYGAYFYFAPPAGLDAVQGPRISADYRLDQALNWNMNWVNRFSFKASWQYDQVRGNLWTAGFEVALPLSRAARASAASMSPLQQQMVAYIRRDVDVVTIQDREDFTPYQLNGHDAKIYFVNSGTELATQAQNTNADIIVVGQNITTDQSITLSNNQTITGQNIEYAPGVLFNATGLATPTTVTQSSASANVFVIGSGNTVRDLSIHYAGTPTVAAITNNTNSVGTFVIDNIDSNAGISINIADGLATSNITIENSLFDMAQAGNAINIQASNGSTVNVTSISGNIIAFGDVSNSAGISFVMQDGAAGFTADSITGNTITIGAGQGNKGISVVNNSTDKTVEQKIKSISDNDITIGGNLQNVNYGIFLSNASNGQQEVIAVEDNKIEFLSGDYNQGLYINNSAQFGTGSTHDTKGIQIIGGISENSFIFPTTSTAANSNAVAVYIDGSAVNDDVPITVILGLHNNSSNNNAIGISFSNLGVGLEPNFIVVNIGGTGTACSAKTTTCEKVLSDINGGMAINNNDNAIIFQ
jgi:hypothetical protein